MKKDYSVLVTAFASVLVIQASSEEEALELATDQLNLGDLQMDEGKVERIIESEEELATHRRHADHIVEAEVDL